MFIPRSKKHVHFIFHARDALPTMYTYIYQYIIKYIVTMRQVDMNRWTLNDNTKTDKMDTKPLLANAINKAATNMQPMRGRTGLARSDGCAARCSWRVAIAQFQTVSLVAHLTSSSSIGSTEPSCDASDL